MRPQPPNWAQIGYKRLCEVTIPPLMPAHGQPITFPTTSPAAAGDKSSTLGKLQLLSLVSLQSPSARNRGWGCPAVLQGPVGCCWLCPSQGLIQSSGHHHRLLLPEKEPFSSALCAPATPDRPSPPKLLQCLLPRSPDLITAGAAGAELAVTRNVLKGPRGSC